MKIGRCVTLNTYLKHTFAQLEMFNLPCHGHTSVHNFEKDKINCMRQTVQNDLKSCNGVFMISKVVTFYGQS